MPEFKQPAASGNSPFPMPSPAGLGDNYNILRRLPRWCWLIRARQLVSFALDKDHPSLITKLGGTTVEISLDDIFGRKGGEGVRHGRRGWSRRVVGAGMGFRVIFKPSSPGAPKVGVGTVDEGVYRDGKWIPGRRLNGDEDDQGRAWRFGSSSLQIERCTTYRYQ